MSNAVIAPRVFLKVMGLGSRSQTEENISPNFPILQYGNDSYIQSITTKEFYLYEPTLGWPYFQKLFIFFQQVTYPIINYTTYIGKDTKKSFRSIGGGLGVHQALENIRLKYKGNGHKIGHNLLSAITFYGMQLSRPARNGA